MLIELSLTHGLSIKRHGKSMYGESCDDCGKMDGGGEVTVGVGRPEAENWWTLCNQENPQLKFSAACFPPLLCAPVFPTSSHHSR